MNYIDLGLSSGTLWSDTNEEGLFAFDDAVKKYGNNIPSKDQLEELMNQCKWEWIGNGYMVTGTNDNSIFLPSAGYCNCGGNVNYVGSYGDYWSSSPYDLDRAWGLGFYSRSVYMGYGSRYYGNSVRLIK